MSTPYNEALLQYEKHQVNRLVKKFEESGRVALRVDKEAKQALSEQLAKSTRAASADDTATTGKDKHAKGEVHSRMAENDSAVPSFSKRFKSIPVLQKHVDLINFFGPVRMASTAEWRRLRYGVNKNATSGVVNRKRYQSVDGLWEEHLRHLHFQTENDPALDYNKRNLVQGNNVNVSRAEGQTSRDAKRGMQCPDYVNWVFLHKMRLVSHVESMEDLERFQEQQRAEEKREMQRFGDAYRPMPEIVFAGRSNVGKSSLINSITGRYVMKASEKPGETQKLSFYKIGRFLTVVDVPGYGFAFAEDDATSNWDEVMKRYFNESTNRVVYLLIDSRHGIKHKDSLLISFLEENHIPFRIVLTKTDLMYSDDLARILQQLETKMRDLNYMIKDTPLPHGNAAKTSDTKHAESSLSTYQVVHEFLHDPPGPVFTVLVSSKSQSGVAFLKTELCQRAMDCKTFDLQQYHSSIKKDKSFFI